MRVITDTEAVRLSERAQRAYQKMLRATTQECKDLYAGVYAQTIDRICEYKRQRHDPAD